MTKSETLHNITKETAKDFIKSVLFVDDNISFGSKDDANTIDANDLTKIFAEKGQACTFFQYSDPSEKSNLLKLIEQSDVCIIDWVFDFKPVPSETEDPVEEEPAPNSSESLHSVKTSQQKVVGETFPRENVEKSKEEVAPSPATPPDDDDGEADYDVVGKGQRAIELLSEAIGKSNGAPKLFIIYSAEHDVDLSEVREVLQGGKKTDPPNEVNTDSIRVVVYNKSGGVATEKSKTYSDLPETITDDFAKLFSGILPNAILKSISSIRDQTNYLLKNFSKELDPAFVCHRALTPLPEEADSLLTKNITDTVNNVLSVYCGRSIVSSSVVNAWIEAHSFTEEILKIPKKKQFPKIDIPIENDKRIEWQRKGYSLFLQDNGVPVDQIDELDRQSSFRKQTEILFLPEEKDASNLHEQFAIITHHKSNMNPAPEDPRLSLGTVVVSTLTESDYYLCIQQRCDSLRISDKEERNFLFLPLVPSDKKVDLILEKEDGSFERLSCNNGQSHSIVTMQFKSTDNSGAVVAEKDANGSLFFETAAGEKLVWLLELQEAHAQRLLQQWVSKLTRVGLDESEWLRRL